MSTNVENQQNNENVRRINNMERQDGIQKNFHQLVQREQNEQNSAVL